MRSKRDQANGSHHACPNARYGKPDHYQVHAKEQKLHRNPNRPGQLKRIQHGMNQPKDDHQMRARHRNHMSQPAGLHVLIHIFLKQLLSFANYQGFQERCRRWIKMKILRQPINESREDGPDLGKLA